MPGNAPISSTKSVSSYADKYLAKTLHSSSQSAENHVPKGLQDNTSSPPMNSYAEIHRRKKEKKITTYSGTTTSTSFAGKCYFKSLFYNSLVINLLQIFHSLLMKLMIRNKLDKLGDKTQSRTLFQLFFSFKTEQLNTI